MAADKNPEEGRGGEGKIFMLELSAKSHVTYSITTITREERKIIRHKL